MAEFVLDTLHGNLNSLVQKELLIFIGFDQHLEKISRLFTTIKETLEDAEEKQFSNRAIKDWLENTIINITVKYHQNSGPFSLLNICYFSFLYDVHFL